MKYSLCLVLCFYSSYVISQEELDEIFISTKDIVLSEYVKNQKDTKNKKIVLNKVLNERLTDAFNNVVFGNSDLVDNASAFGYALNKKETKVSLSSNLHLGGKSVVQWFLKAGIDANGSNGVFSLYEDSAWQSSSGGKVGIIVKFAGSGISNFSNNELRRNHSLRSTYIDSLQCYNSARKKAANYEALLKEYGAILKRKFSEGKFKKIESLYDKLKSQEEIFSSLYAQLTISERDTIRKGVADTIEKRNEKRNLGEENSETKIDLVFNDYSNSNQQEINQLIIGHLQEDLNDPFKNNLKTLIKDYAYNFDKEYIFNTGYTFHWVDLNIALNNDEFNFSETAKNVESNVLEDFKSATVKKTEINKLRTKVSIAYNYMCYAKKQLLFLKLGFDYNAGSFLKSNIIRGTPVVNEVLANNAGFLVAIKDDKESYASIGNSNAVEETLRFGRISAYGAVFFRRKKTIGFNFLAAQNFTIGSTPLTTDYRLNYTILAGPIFRKTDKNGKTELTFGVDIGFQDSLYKDRAKENFVAKVKIAIPFKLFKIKK